MNNPPRYTLPAIVLHWVTALLVVTLFGLGWYMVELPKGPQRAEMFALHKSFGLTVLWLLALRVAWRLGHRPPALPAGMPLWPRRRARAVHLALYALLATQPLSGYVSSSFSGHDTAYFGIPLPRWGHHDAPLNELFTEIHEVSSVLLLSAIVMHLVGALSHLRPREENVIARMWPW